MESVEEKEQSIVQGCEAKKTTRKRGFQRVTLQYISFEPCYANYWEEHLEVIQ